MNLRRKEWLRKLSPLADMSASQGFHGNNESEALSIRGESW